MPQLSLRGTSKPVIVGDAAFSGFDNGHVTGDGPERRRTQWDVNIAPPTGRSEIERLNDMDSTVKVVGSDVYAVSFQARRYASIVKPGQVVWASRCFQLYRPGRPTMTAIYVSDSSGDAGEARSRQFRHRGRGSRSAGKPAPVSPRNAGLAWSRSWPISMATCMSSTPKVSLPVRIHACQRARRLQRR